MPALDYGMSGHPDGLALTLTLRPQTLELVVIDIAESLLQHGITRLLVVSAHDGNPPAAEQAARELQLRHGMSVALFFGWQSLSRRLLAGVHDIDMITRARRNSPWSFISPELAPPRTRSRSSEPAHGRTGSRLRPFSNRGSARIQRQASKGMQPRAPRFSMPLAGRSRPVSARACRQRLDEWCLLSERRGHALDGRVCSRQR
ncbi:MAG: creatininase family protein [Thermomicrobiales bacterium]